MYENAHNAMAISSQRRAPNSLQNSVENCVALGIVILSYNTVDLLRACLASVLASEIEVAYKVCVVDNASTDGTVAMVRREFPQVELIENRVNAGYSAGNNIGLRWFGFEERSQAQKAVAQTDAVQTDAVQTDAVQTDIAQPTYLLLLNSDTVVPKGALAEMVQFLASHPAAGAAGPRVRRPDGSLDRACRRGFPTPAVSFYRMMGLSRLFPNSPRFNAYNLAYWPEDAVHQADSVVGAFMLLRRAAIVDAGLLDEQFFMYGEDLDWAKRIKEAGWEIWYNGQVQITHVKEASSRQSSKSRIDFYEAMWIFYHKHYRAGTAWYLDRLILAAIAVKGGLDVARHLWRFGHDIDGNNQTPPGTVTSGPAKSGPVQPSTVQPEIANLQQRPSSGVSRGGR